MRESMMNNTVIFIFGFIVGGFTLSLIFGLLFLSREKTRTSKNQNLVSEPGQDAEPAKIYSKLKVLNG